MECVDDLRKCVLRFLLLMEQMNRNGFCLRYVRFVLCAFGRCFICRIPAQLRGRSLTALLSLRLCMQTAEKKRTPTQSSRITDLLTFSIFIMKPPFNSTE